MNSRRLAYSLLLAAMPLIAAQVFAAPVNLACTNKHDDSEVRRVTFDESSGTAFLGGDAASDATFTDTTIKWSGTYDGDRRWGAQKSSFILDRMTGVLVVSYHIPSGGTLRAEFSCSVSEKKF
jgi:hypothetical protein